LGPVHSGGTVAAPGPAIRLRSATRVRRRVAVQPVAQPCRAQAAGKLQPCAAPDVLGTGPAAPGHEPGGARRADRRGAIPRVTRSSIRAHAGMCIRRARGFLHSGNKGDRPTGLKRGAVMDDSTTTPVIKDVPWPLGTPSAGVSPATEATPPATGDWAVCCSGGGIRSATYCLGGLQALEEGALLRRTKWIVGVSGGSYIAASR